MTKRYHPPAAPYQRLLLASAVPAEVKAKLSGMFAVLDPLRLLGEIRGAQERVAEIAAGRPVTTTSTPQDEGLGHFLKRLSMAWRDGEVRPTHRQPSRSKHYWRTREDPFAGVWPTIRGWLEAEPERTAKELFQRLRLREIGKFTDGQLRTLQRRVKAWRSEMARQLIYGEADFTVADSGQTELSREPDGVMRGKLQDV